MVPLQLGYEFLVRFMRVRPNYPGYGLAVSFKVFFRT
jgi:hypothetical protein